MIQKKWFRVETAADGSILSCTQVEAKGRSGAVVRFYEARDKADACSQAKQWVRVKRLEMFARRRAEGRCYACEKPRLPGKKGCSVHSRTRKEVEAQLRKLQRKEERAAAAASLRESLLVDLRLVLRRFDSLGQVAFRAWLESKIRAAQQTHGEKPIAEAAE